MLQVINRDHKAEISALASELAAGATGGSQEHFAKYATALATFKERMSPEELAAAEAERKIWDEKGLPDDIKINNGLKYSKKVLFAAAEGHFKEMGLRGFFWEFHYNTDGIALYHL